jgi:replicative DNA helicase
VAAVLERIRGRWQTLGLRDEDNRTLGQVGRDILGEWAAPRTDVPRFTWPIQKLQDNLGHLTDELVYIAAKESVGKTALALQIAVCLGHAGVKTAVKSLESRRDRLVPRLLSQIGEINTLMLRHGKAPPSDWDRARNAAAKLDALPIAIDDAPASVEQLRGWAVYQKQRGAQVLIVDNMRHIRLLASRKGRAEQFAELAMQIKMIRDDTRLPLIVLHHLSKDEDVAWSREVRNDADILLFLTDNEDQCIAPCQANGWCGHWVVDVTVEKNRDGERGQTIALWFDKPHQTFHDVAAGGANERRARAALR